MSNALPSFRNGESDCTDMESMVLGVVNTRAKNAVHAECDNRENSLKMKLPAYGVTVFSCTPEKKVSSVKRVGKKVKISRK